ncbi:D-alanyl-D-alanine carboxypeptidase family protein, partial [Kitasatospora sp. NPDC059646]|uniref:D-alanyl-D-alanine carboxypeptidase family protein n=1 Tax=Kitasatospora sp. NPDC059646 TaxID=3346893 RepID=UPI00368DA49C
HVGKAAEEEKSAPAVAEPTMTLRIEKVAEPEEEEKPASTGPEPTMTLRVGKAAEEEKSAPAVAEPTMTLRIEKVAEPEKEEKPASTGPEPTMTLRVGKAAEEEKAEEEGEKPAPAAKSEQTVMLRLPKDESAPKPAPAPAPKAVPAPKAAPVPAPAAAPAAVAPAAAPGPESTIEALEVLKALSARPMTPFRRAMKRVLIWGVFLAVVLGVLASVQLLRPLPAPKAKLGLADSFTFQGEQLSIPWPTKGQAAAEVVGVGDLGASGEQTPVPIASVTKVMNAYLILQAHPLKKGQSGPMLTVDKQAAQESSNADESKVTLTEGQQLSEYEALEMLMLPSANNVARLLARWDSGSEEAFVRKMNDTARQFGMTNTTYADPAGYNNDTKSTAKDQLKLAEQVMKDEVFRQVIAEPDTKFNGQRIFNTNKVLGKNGMIGGKTGSSTPAQSCFMWAAVKEIGGVKRTLLGVTLGQPATKEETSLVNAAQPVSQKINVAAQAALTGQTLAKQGDVVGQVDDGVGGKVPVVAAKDLTVAGWSGITAHLTLTPIGKIAHTLPAGSQVGTLSAGDGDGRVEIPVTLQKDLAPPSITARLLRLG